MLATEVCVGHACWCGVDFGTLNSHCTLGEQEPPPYDSQEIKAAASLPLWVWGQLREGVRSVSDWKLSDMIMVVSLWDQSSFPVQQLQVADSTALTNSLRSLSNAGLTWGRLTSHQRFLQNACLFTNQPDSICAVVKFAWNVNVRIISATIWTSAEIYTENQTSAKFKMSYFASIASIPARRMLRRNKLWWIYFIVVS